MAGHLTKQRLKSWGIIFLVFTLLALMNYTRFVTNELAEGQPGKYLFYFIMEATGSYTVLLLLPFMLWFFDHAPITRRNLHTSIPSHLLATVAFGISHTLLMYGSRSLVFRLADMGTYDYGVMEYRFLMEYSNQFFAYWTILAVVMLINSVRERQQQELRASRLEQQLTRARLQALQMQLNPHFLFNTLNMISSTIYDDAQAADKMIANLSDLLRKTLTAKAEDEHTLAQERELIDLYLDIMHARFGDNLLVHMDMEADTMNAFIPRFVLQPLVENAVKYGMETLGQTEITIQSRRQEDRMVLTITDNGPGFPDTSSEMTGKGIGLSSTEERLEKLYGTDQHLHLENREEGGCRVVVEIPFRAVEETPCPTSPS